MPVAFWSVHGHDSAPTFIWVQWWRIPVFSFQKQGGVHSKTIKRYEQSRLHCMIKDAGTGEVAPIDTWSNYWSYDLSIRPRTIIFKGRACEVHWLCLSFPVSAFFDGIAFFSFVQSAEMRSRCFQHPTDTKATTTTTSVLKYIFLDVGPLPSLYSCSNMLIFISTIMKF
jgi:hypothetical protein